METERPTLRSRSSSLSVLTECEPSTLEDISLLDGEYENEFISAQTPIRLDSIVLHEEITKIQEKRVCLKKRKKNMRGKNW